MTKIAVIGTGRVGLPLALTFIEKGLDVVGIDTNQELIDSVNDGIMPFHEPGYEELISSKKLKIYKDYAVLQDCDYIIITVGTPLLAHIETDLQYIKLVINSILPYLRQEQTILLRSTVAPGTSDFVKKFIEKNKNWILGRDFYLCFCPERIAEGKAYTELQTLPQIIGSEDMYSFNKANELFLKIVNDIFQTDFISAELTKLFNNISRYVYFGVSNYFAIIAEEYGVNVYDVIKMANYKYPRTIVALPGFTAGTCLRKDFGMINENLPFGDMLLSAWKVNEFMPKFIVNMIKQKTNIYHKMVGILGYSFKADTDDSRDSLVPKLVRYLEREVPNGILIHEPNIKALSLDNKYANIKLEEIDRKSVV